MIVAVEYEFVPEATERRLAARPAHREWLASLKADGRLVQAGPFADGRAAMLDVDVDDDVALDDLLAADPLSEGLLRRRLAASVDAAVRRHALSPRRETTDQTSVGADSLC